MLSLGLKTKPSLGLAALPILCPSRQVLCLQPGYLSQEIYTIPQETHGIYSLDGGRMHNPLTKHHGPRRHPFFPFRFDMLVFMKLKNVRESAYQRHCNTTQA